MEFDFSNNSKENKMKKTRYSIIYINILKFEYLLSIITQLYKKAIFKKQYLTTYISHIVI